MNLNSTAAAIVAVIVISTLDLASASCGGKGGKGGKGGSHHNRHGGVSVGVGADLGGVGQRKREADPFAVPQEPSSSSSSRSTAKKTKKPTQDSSSGNVFANVRLTGPESKIAKVESAQTAGQP